MCGEALPLQAHPFRALVVGGGAAVNNALTTLHKISRVSWHLVSQLPEYGQGEPETGLAIAVLTLSRLEKEAAWNAKYEAFQFCDAFFEATESLHGMVANLAVEFDISKMEADSYVRIWLKNNAPRCAHLLPEVQS